MTTENEGEGIKKQYMDDSYRFQLSTRKEKQGATEEWCRAKLAKEQPALLPCPFCGTNFQRVHGQDDTTLRLCRVVCDECLYGGPNFKTRDMAIAWWNKRSKEPPEK